MTWERKLGPWGLKWVSGENDKHMICETRDGSFVRYVIKVFSNRKPHYVRVGSFKTLEEAKNHD